MKTTRLKQARRLFFHEAVPANIARHNARQWARSLRYLGDRWLLAGSLRSRSSTKVLGSGAADNMAAEVRH